MLLVIMGRFKGRNIDEMRKFYDKNSGESLIIPENLTNKFQPLDLSVSKTAKSCVFSRYNPWLANKIQSS